MPTTTRSFCAIIQLPSLLGSGSKPMQLFGLRKTPDLSLALPQARSPWVGTGSVPATGGWSATARSHILPNFSDTRSDCEAIRVRGVTARIYVRNLQRQAPHPDPLRASFARLDPAKSGEREESYPSPSSLASKPFTARAQPLSFRSRVAALMFGLKRCSSRQLSANFSGSG